MTAERGGSGQQKEADAAETTRDNLPHDATTSGHAGADSSEAMRGRPQRDGKRRMFGKIAHEILPDETRRMMTQKS